MASSTTCQQGKMKLHHDKHVKFREMAVSDTILAQDHLSGQNWQPGTILNSYKVQSDDERIWRWHVDDVIQNNPSKSTESSTMQHKQILLKTILHSLHCQLWPAHL